MRALESEIPRTFPAIKKQVDSLYEADVIDIEKDSTRRAITIKKDFYDNIKNIFLYTLQKEIIEIWETHPFTLEKFFFGNVFGNNIDIDIVVIHKNIEKQILDKIKEEIGEVFKNFFIDNPTAVFMSWDEFQKRYRLADKFVLHIIKNTTPSGFWHNK